MATSTDVRNSKTFPKAKDRNEYFHNLDIEPTAIASRPEGEQLSLMASQATRLVVLSGLKHRVRSGFNDPLSVALVLDAMVCANPNAYLRASYLTPWLNRNRTDFIWEPITIGRIMGEVVDVAAETFAGYKYYPVDRGTDWRGHYIVIDPDGGHEGRLWLMRLIDRLLPKCAEVMEVERDGTIVMRSDSVWSDVDTGR